MICPICGSERIRLSRLRVADYVRLLLFTYPVRCAECFERDSVNLITALSIYQQSRARRHARKSRNTAPPHSTVNGA
jgi:hypothetical protein